MTRKINDLEKQWFLNSVDSQLNNLKNLLEQDPNLATKKDFIMGFTALHWAAKNGSYDTVSFLLECGVETESKTNGGYTPLHLATIYNHNNIILLLVDNYDANIDARDNSGKRPKDYLRPNAMPSVKDKLQGRNTSKADKKDGENPMTNISNMFLQMCIVSPPQADVCQEERNAVLLSPLCLIPPKPETNAIKLKNSTRRSRVYTTFRKARPTIRKSPRVSDGDNNQEAKMKIGPPMPLKDNFLDFSGIPRNERARSMPEVGRLIQELQEKLKER